MTGRDPESDSEREARDERLLDESLEETFPASDPILPARPGSTLSERSRADAALAPGNGTLRFFVWPAVTIAVAASVLARALRIR